MTLETAPNPAEAHGRRLDIYRGANVVVTGGVGLIGSHVARRLCALGAKVLVIDSLIPDFGGNPRNIHDIEGAITLNVSDIRDVYGLRYLLRGKDFLFNLAGQTSHIGSMAAPFEDLEINCHAQLAILEVCREVNANIKIVFASTRQIYGRPEYLPVDEKHPLRPVDVNGINKIAGEWYHLLYSDMYDLKATVLRLTNVFGPGMRIKDAQQIFLGIWIRRLIEGQSFELWGGSQLRDFTYVSDAAEAILLAGVTEELFGRAFNIGGVPPVTLRQLADALIESNGGNGSYDVREFPKERKKIDIGDYYSDDRLFRAASGWAPKVSLAEGLRLTVEYYRDNIQYYL
jgi:nucleoside-diphosphate-sugar epimerase